MNNLKPCPFCGEYLVNQGFGWFHPEAGCLISDILLPHTENLDWNTRTPDPRIAELESAIKKDSQLLAKVLFENAAIQNQLAQKWLPIESAPKDGSDILIFVQKSSEQFVGYWQDSEWLFGDFKDGKWLVILDPTHWQPLPPSSGEGNKI